VKLKRPPLSRLSLGDTNYVRFRLSPDVIIGIGARVKRSGDAMVSDPTELSVVERPNGEEMDAYERLLGDAMVGDVTLFARQDAVEAAWKIVDPVLASPTPPHEYEPGSWGPPAAEALASGVGGWHCPECAERSP
jgi:glucose-6-phosphate 1-dehydrogenase